MKIVYILAVAIILYICQKRIFKKYWSRGLDLAVSFGCSNLYEGEKTEIVETVTNRKLMPLTSLRVKFMTSRYILFDDTANSRITDNFYRCDCVSVMMNSRLRRHLAITASKRGIYEISEPTAVSRSPFFESESVMVFKGSDRLVVYPKLLDLDTLEADFKKMFGTVLTKRNINEDPFEFRGIRDYTRFDPMKSVNWKASAKSGALKVNTHDYTSSRQVIIYMNLEFQTLRKQEALFEETLRLAASLSYLFLEKQIPVSLYTNARSGPDSAPLSVASGAAKEHLSTILTGIAGLDFNAKPEALPLLAERMKHHEDSNDYIVLISSNQSAELTEALDSIVGRGLSCSWIVPTNSEIELTASSPYYDIIEWHIEQ